MDAARLDSWAYVKPRLDGGARMIGDAFEGLKFAFENAPAAGLILEFGVRHGTSIRYLAGLTPDTIDGFDSFAGLPEAWGDEAAGVYSTHGELPDVPAHVRLHAGLFADTLAPFLASHPGPVRLVNVDCDKGAPEVDGSHMLLAVGRRPNTDDLGLDAAGVEVDARGHILVDDTLQTNVPGIWALGECNGRGAFTHTAYNDYEIVAANLLHDDPRRVTDRIECYGLYIDPPLGRVGMTERQVRESGRPALVTTRPMTRVSRAVEKGETQGFMKILVDAETKRILGAAILTSYNKYCIGLSNTTS